MSKKRVKDLKKQLRKDGANPELRVELASLYADSGQTKEAVEMYLGVAFDHYKARALEDARQVCQTILKLAPQQRETADLLKVIDLALRSKRASSEVDALATKGDWVPSLKTPTGDRAVTATGASKVASAKRADERRAGERLATDTTQTRAATGGRKGRVHARAATDERPTARRQLDQAANQAKRPRPDSARPGDDFQDTPTPLPMPLAPHEADDEDSVVEDQIERHKLDPNPAGSIPRISLPANLVPVFDEMIDENHLDQQIEELGGAPGPAPRSRPRGRPRSEESPGFMDEEPTQLTVLGPEERARIAEEEVHERLSTEDLSIEEIAAAEDAGDTMTMARQQTVPRPPLEGAAPRDETTAEHAPWRGSAPALDPFQDDDDMGPTGEHPIRASHRDIPVPIEPEATIRVVVSRPPLLEEPVVGSNPFIDLPERPDGLPLVIHDHAQLADALPSGFADALPSGFADPRHGERKTTLRSVSSSIDPLEAFARLPAAALDELASRMTMRHYTADQYIVRQEERARCCYVVVAGEIAVLRYDPMDRDGDYQEIARLQPGQLFGESCLLPVRWSRGSALALGDCDLYEIPRRMLRELAAVHDGVDPCLDAIYRDRCVESLFATHPFLRGLKPRHQDELRAHVQIAHHPSGTSLLEEGSESGGLALVLVGAIEVTKRLSRSRSTLLATVEEGSHLSDISSLAGGTARATVRAAGAVELATLAPDRFRRVIDQAPELWDTLCAERGRGALERNYLCTGPGLVI